MPTDDDVPMTDSLQPPAPSTTAAPSEPPRTDHEWQYYYLPSEPVKPLVPLTSQNLISLYDLNNLMNSVRRTDPVTGEKINKLRKSYEGKVKTLHLSGINKPSNDAAEFTNPGGKPLSEVPEGTKGFLDFEPDEWLHEKLQGRPIQAPTEDFQAKLERALQMRPGGILDANKWDKIIGPAESKTKSSFDPARVAVPQSSTGRNSPLLKASNSVRPERAGAKRRYTDHTFTGYGEGLSDDVGDSAHEEERKSAHINKKRRKDNIGVASPLSGPSYNAPGVMAGGSRSR
ncbi:Rox3-domain-containing protein [Venturia nashicola]|nr:Rox3-domain-containing protein [Venturia nashicola]